MPRRRRAPLARDVRGRWLARGSQVVSSRGRADRVRGTPFLDPKSSRVGASTLRYFGAHPYDPTLVARLPSGWADLRPVERGVVRVHVEMSRFNAGITRFISRFSPNVSALVRAHGLDLLARIQARTPRRTGRLANSFHMIPPNSRLFRFTYADSTGRSFEGSLEGVTTGPFEVVVGTNVEYAPAIEAGHSRQAPQGMVAVSVREKSTELEAAIAQAVRTNWNQAL